jgi:hypothetical protein
MAVYKFEQFNEEIINPAVEVRNVVDNINNKTCVVEVMLNTDTVGFGVSFTGFTYVDTWTDEEIIDWVNDVELPKYEVPA